MSSRRTRERQLAKLAARRAAERHRRRRQRLLAGVVAAAVALGGLGVLAFALWPLGGDEPNPAATATPTPTDASPGPGEAACGGEVPEGAGEGKQEYEQPPEMTIDRSRTYEMTMQTSCGRIVMELLPRKAPQTVNSLVFLAREGFFDGLTFHRIVKDFVIQGGDPFGNGSGGPGYQTVDPPPEGARYREGDVAMAKTGTDPPGTAGSQFFIVTGDPSPLNATGGYAIVGRVIEGLDVAKGIEQLPAEGDAQDGAPQQTVYIERVKVRERG